MQTFWNIRPLSPPPILRHCSRCGPSRFRSSGLFRINAQQKSLDVWLIWRCEDCGRTWNMDILTRVRPGEIDPHLYLQYQQNDAALAMRCAFDPALHKNNGTTPLLTEVPFEVEGDPVLLSPGGDVQLMLRCEIPLPVKLTRVLAQKMELSIGELQRWEQRGQITLLDRTSLSRAKLRDGQGIRLHAPLAVE